jgi:7,8-dihydropterin-6-yl-methyl-4-(beta-D-ribofuranosyl)aminobenzene 5'-phosphate synthase
MRLTVLVDNKKGKCESEFGLSFLIEDDKKILFDTGASDLFLKNAKNLDIKLDNIDMIVLSHGHWDHGNGLGHIRGFLLICHPDCFIKRYRKDGTYIGLPLNQEEAKKKFDLFLSKKPYLLSDNITFLGEIPRKNDFEAKTTNFYKENKKDDFVIDDSALAIRSKKGLIVITGCSHAGICNIIEYAKEVTNINNVYAVIGGFHLREINETTKKTIDYLKKEKIEKIIPCHCVADEVIGLFKKELNSDTIYSGDSIEI